MKAEIKIIHTNGREQYLTHLRSKERREYGTEDLASLFVPRTEIDPREIDEGRDRAELRYGGEVLFAGPIEDVVRDGDQKEIIVESTERYAERAEPTGAVDEWNNVPDADIVRDAIEDVPELEIGHIGTTNPAVSLLFSHASQAFKARKAENVSPGVLRYNPDLTVDYGRLGRNKTHVTLSPRRANVSEDFEVDRSSGYDQVTHLRVLGAGEGEHQIQAEAVADDYDPADPEIWMTYPDKGLADEATAQTKAENWVNEMSTQLLEVELIVKGTEVGVGDLFRVYIPTEEVDDYLEVVKHDRVIDAEGIRHEVTLSNHRDTREDPEEKNRADLEHYNSAVEGNSVPINTSGGRQPVDPNNNYEVQLYYPAEVEYEHRLNVRVVGLPYRAYSSGAADNADFESTVVASTDISTANVFSDGWATVAEFQVPDSVSTSTMYSTVAFIVEDFSDDGSLVGIRFRYTTDNVDYIPAEDGFACPLSPLGSSAVTFADPTDVSGELIRIEADIGLGPDAISSLELNTSEMFLASGKHIHPPNPGIIEGFGDFEERFFPEDCQVLVNGDPVGDPIEGGQFRWDGSIDIRGDLNQGQMNRIEVTSGTLGHMQGYVEGDLYRQIRSRG